MIPQNNFHETEDALKWLNPIISTNILHSSQAKLEFVVSSNPTLNTTDFL